MATRKMATIELGTNFRDTKILIDGKELDGVLGLSIEANPDEILVAHVKLTPGKVSGDLFLDPNVEFVEKKDDENNKG